MAARVVVLAGPSGSGKSRLVKRLADRWGLPVLRLDDFYKDGDDPTLPRIAEGPPSRSLVPRHLRTGRSDRVDWDHPASWLPTDALVALNDLCHTGTAEVPVYDIAHDGRTGTHELRLDGAELVLAEGIFAQEIVGPCQEAGVLAAAYCLRQPAVVTFWRRLSRDLRERRKPPLVLVRRGLALARAQREVVAHAVALGCRAVSTEQAHAEISALADRTPRTSR